MVGISEWIYIIYKILFEFRISSLVRRFRAGWRAFLSYFSTPCRCKFHIKVSDLVLGRGFRAESRARLSTPSFKESSINLSVWNLVKNVSDRSENTFLKSIHTSWLVSNYFCRWTKIFHGGNNFYFFTPRYLKFISTQIWKCSVKSE